MSRTTSGSNGYIELNPATDNPTSVQGTISTSAGYQNIALFAPSGANWTVTNTGSILGSSTAARSSAAAAPRSPLAPATTC